MIYDFEDFELLLSYSDKPAKIASILAVNGAMTKETLALNLNMSAKKVAVLLDRLDVFGIFMVTKVFPGSGKSVVYYRLNAKGYDFYAFYLERKKYEMLDERQKLRNKKQKLQDKVLKIRDDIKKLAIKKLVLFRKVRLNNLSKKIIKYNEQIDTLVKLIKDFDLKIN